MKLEIWPFWPDLDLTFTINCWKWPHTTQWTQQSNSLANVDQELCVAWPICDLKISVTFCDLCFELEVCLSVNSFFFGTYVPNWHLLNITGWQLHMLDLSSMKQFIQKRTIISVLPQCIKLACGTSPSPGPKAALHPCWCYITALKLFWYS